MSDLDILLGVPDTRLPVVRAYTTVFIRPGWSQPLTFLGRCVAEPETIIEAWCLPSGVKLSEAFA